MKIIRNLTFIKESRVKLYNTKLITIIIGFIINGDINLSKYFSFFIRNAIITIWFLSYNNQKLISILKNTELQTNLQYAIKFYNVDEEMNMGIQGIIKNMNYK